VDIEYDQDNDLLIHHLGNETTDLKTHIEKAVSFIELMEKFQPLRVLIYGHLENVKFDMRLNGWIESVLLPQAKKTRLRKIAFHIDNLQELSVVQGVSENSIISVRIFNDKDQAYNWLMLP